MQVGEGTGSTLRVVRSHTAVTPLRWRRSDVTLVLSHTMAARDIVFPEARHRMISVDVADFSARRGGARNFLERPFASTNVLFSGMFSTVLPDSHL